jgi:hypothetical protein
MESLSESFITSCRKDRGMIFRGEAMTRIETFVDAAFAFAFTLLVISIDSIPTNTKVLMGLSLDIPAFISSALTIGVIWFAHAQWSRVFGLQDLITTTLSILLVIFVLIFVYPIKLMFRVTFSYFSGGYFSQGLDPLSRSDTSTLIIYFSVGFFILASLFIILYLNTLKFKRELRLNCIETYFCISIISRWILVCLTALISCAIAYLFDEQLPFAIYIYFTLPFSIFCTEHFFITKYFPANSLDSH